MILHVFSHRAGSCRTGFEIAVRKGATGMLCSIQFAFGLLIGANFQSKAKLSCSNLTKPSIARYDYVRRDYFTSERMTG